MRHLVLAAAVLIGGACAGDGAPDPSGGGGGGDARAVGTLTADFFPFDAPPARFQTSQRGAVAVRLEPIEGGAAMWITGDGLTPRRIDWIRDGGSIYCSDGPDRRVEFLRIGAAPGASWTSSGRTIRFVGWERVETPAGQFDTVRISSTLEVDPYVETETWWFAREHGLIRMRVDKGELYSIEMSRVP